MNVTGFVCLKKFFTVIIPLHFGSVIFICVTENIINNGVFFVLVPRLAYESDTLKILAINCR